MPKERLVNGQFKRQRSKPWVPADGDDGWPDADGRFWVYRPDFPGTKNRHGYAKRSHVAVWLSTGVVAGKDLDVHHKNTNRLDDSIDNLEVKEHSKHSQLHNAERKSAAAVECVCVVCANPFTIPRYRLREGRGKYCSHSCYTKVPKSLETRLKTALSLTQAYSEGRR